MSKTMIKIGSIIDYPTVHDKQIAGEVELILENTVMIRDFEDDTHLVLKRTLTEDGLFVDEQSFVPRTQFSKR